jgi:hypothetical protein
LAYAAGAALALCTLAATARAQGNAAPHADEVPGLAVLRDADTPGLVAALRADVARRTAHGRATATIATSGADPLAYVRARTAHFVLPPDARYDETCSRAMSEVLFRPVAVFAVGRPADDIPAGLRGRELKSLSQKEIYGLIVAQTQSSAGRAFDATIRFYRARGFQTVGTVNSQASLRWKGTAPDPVSAGVHLFNVGAGNDPRRCGQLGNTALLTLSITEQQAWSKTSSAAAAAQTSTADAGAAFANTLSRAGMTERRYMVLVDAAWQALRDTQDPQQAAKTDAMARVPQLRAQADARRENRAWMERHRDERGPLLDAYARSLDARGGG